MSRPELDEGVEMLEAVGAVKSVSLWKEGFLLFGPRGLPPLGATRRSLPVAATGRFNALSDEIAADPDSIDRLMVEYILKHKEAFAGSRTQ